MQQKRRNNRKFRYDEQDGVFVFEDEIGVNWLLNQVLQTVGLQITKVSTEELQRFLFLLKESDLRMPDGKYCLFWLKDNIKEKHTWSGSLTGEAWVAVNDRYRYILEQIDHILITVPNIQEKMKVDVPVIKYRHERDENKMEARFDLIDPIINPANPN